jgi:hypothetical protein
LRAEPALPLRLILGKNGDMPTNPEAEATAATAEIVADELADVALDDPERAAQFVAAVTSPPVDPSPPVELAPQVQPAAGGVARARSIVGSSAAERAVPAALVGVFLLQVLPKGRIKRLGLAVLGSALVAGLVAGKQQQR